VELTRRQRNDIFEALLAEGVDPAECSIKAMNPVLPSEGIRIAHPDSHSYMNVGFGGVPGYYFCELIIGGVQLDKFGHSRWSDVIHWVKSWACDVACETSGPNLWAVLRRVPEIMTAVQAADATNAPFTPDEQAEISTRIDQAKDAVPRENPGLAAEQKLAIEQTLDEVKEATTRVGRRDWVMLANGALLSLIVNNVVPPHVVQSVFNMLITGIGHLFGIGGPPPMIST
jgi:hypothetical protein